jgi:hypothetical protein
MANYDDWKAAVEAELKARGLDITEANDWYSWPSAYKDCMTPYQAVSDYQEWMEE